MAGSPTTSIVRLLALVTLLLCGRVGSAAPGRDARADAQLALATRLYLSGELDQAVAAVHAGQLIEPRPAFLYALGQIARRRGHCMEAIDYYERYLALKPPASGESAARTQIERCRAETPLADDPEARAQLYFQAGEAAFRLGHYADAVREWRQGYALLPRPLFLLDLAQAYRRLEDPHHALPMYEQFLATLAPDDPKRAEIERTIAAVRVESEQRAPRGDVPDDFTPPPSDRPTVTVTSSPQPVVAPHRRRWWIIPTTLGITAVAGVAIGLGVYYGRDANHFDCTPSGAIACIHATSAP